MIRGYSDHAANERTFLAWVRTAIAVMAFGFLVEKFDLFLELAAPSLTGRTLSLPGQKFGNIAGLALIVLGTAMVVIAAIRFLITARNIDSEEPHPAPEHGSMWRLPSCSSFSAARCSSISPTRWSRRREVDRGEGHESRTDSRRRTMGCRPRLPPEPSRPRRTPCATPLRRPSATRSMPPRRRAETSRELRL